jgi:hypothetical protein
MLQKIFFTIFTYLMHISEKQIILKKQNERFIMQQRGKPSELIIKGSHFLLFTLFLGSADLQNSFKIC